MSLPKPYYEAEGITIYHGDCRDILTHLEPVDLVLTDIPFNVNLNYASYKDNLSNEDFARLCEEWFCAFRSCSSFFIVKAPTKTMPYVLPAFNIMLGYIWTIIQHSPNAMTHGPFNLSLYTQYLIGGKPIKRPNMDFFINTKQEPKSLHPAAMPIFPIQKLINWFTEKKHSIVDPFMGSGTTLVAAKQLGRKAIGIEIEEKYCAIAVKRLAQKVLPF
jgi:site-specific DNA-methyltransferase (adenine-specific)